jgi:hypothetical protein
VTTSRPTTAETRLAHSFAAAVALLAAAVGMALIVGALTQRTWVSLLGDAMFLSDHEQPPVEIGDVAAAAAGLVLLVAAGYGVGLVVGVPLTTLEKRLSDPTALSAGDIAGLFVPKAEPAPAAAVVPVVTSAAVADEPETPAPIPVRAVVQFRHAPVAPRAGTPGARRRVAAARSRSATRARARYRTP